MSVQLVQLRGRAALIRGKRVVDLARRSDGRFSADPMEAVAQTIKLRPLQKIYKLLVNDIKRF